MSEGCKDRPVAPAGPWPPHGDKETQRRRQQQREGTTLTHAGREVGSVTPLIRSRDGHAQSAARTTSPQSPAKWPFENEAKRARFQASHVLGSAGPAEPPYQTSRRPRAAQNNGTRGGRGATGRRDPEPPKPFWRRARGEGRRYPDFQTPWEAKAIRGGSSAHQGGHTDLRSGTEHRGGGRH